MRGLDRAGWAGDGRRCPRWRSPGRRSRCRPRPARPRTSCCRPPSRSGRAAPRKSAVVSPGPTVARPLPAARPRPPGRRDPDHRRHHRALHRRAGHRCHRRDLHPSASEGEWIPPELAELAPDRGDQPGGYRTQELDGALPRSAARPPLMPGGAGRWRDTGMPAGHGNPRRAASDPASGGRSPRLRVRYPARPVAGDRCRRGPPPQVLVSYADDGGYAPWTTSAHRADAVAAAAAYDRTSSAKLYFTVRSAALLADGLAGAVVQSAAGTRHGPGCAGRNPTSTLARKTPPPSRPGSTCRPTTTRGSPPCGRTPPRSTSGPGTGGRRSR
ncbi:hypothetical protein HBB16_20565 [Pseudonocardia sp. MCCB 268]|nr:hypothetical protein [Pseudonocardia cytotoxica]